MEPLNLLSFPEELLEKILAHCVVAHTPHPPRPSWHSSSATTPPVRGRLALLLVSKTFLRIATPLFYHSLHIASPSQLHCLLRDALRPNLALASHIRRVVLAGIWAEGGELLQLCHTRLETLDIILDTMAVAPGVQGEVRDLDAEEFCAALTEMTALTHLVVRKPCNVYLTQPRPRYVLSALAEAMHSWDKLEHADLAFRVADDAAGRGAPGPMANLTRALATRPRLHTLATMLPNVWNEAMLRVSENPALERIVLADGVGAGPAQARGATWAGARAFYAAPVAAALPAPAPAAASEGVYGGSIQCTGLFFAQAKKHSRLCELIRAGTFIMRTRAKTMAPPGGAQRAYSYARSQTTVPVADVASKERPSVAPEHHSAVGLEASTPSTSSRPRSLTHASLPRGSVACAAASSR